MEKLTHFELVPPTLVEENATISKNFFKSENLRAMLFSFAKDEELTDHSSKKQAVLFVIKGTGEFGTAEETVELKPNVWVHIPAGLTHRVKAFTELHFTLSMFG